MSIRTLLSARDAWFLKGLGHKAVLQTVETTASDTQDGNASAREQHGDAATASSEKGSTSKNKPMEYASQESEKSPAKPEEKADKSNEELFRIRASRWVDFFPNELVIREKSITVIKRDFMYSQTETWPIEDIGEVTLQNAPVFSGLHVVGKFPKHKLHLKGISKDKAIKAKEIIDGLVLEDQEQIDLPEDSSPSAHRKMLTEAGKLPEGTGPSPEK